MPAAIRRAAVLGMMSNDTIETVRACLPANYTATQGETGPIMIEGTDSHGWTKADLTKADLTGAVLTGANLTKADLTGVLR